MSDDGYNLGGSYTPGGNSYPPQDTGSPGLWLGLSIASTLCCCVPFGIVGIVFSALAMNARDRGADWDYEKYLGRAKGWTIASIVCGLIAGVIYLLIGLSNRSPSVS
jgi:hypothetical protein